MWRHVGAAAVTLAGIAAAAFAAAAVESALEGKR